MIVRDWPHSHDGSAYLEPLMQTARHHTACGGTVTFVSFCAEDDRDSIQRLRHAGHDVLVWNPKHDDAIAFVESLAEHQVIATARYHGAIFAALLRKPCICIEIEPKLRVAAATLGLDDYVWSQPFRPAELHALVEKLSCDETDATARVRAAVAEQRELAELMVRDFTEFVVQNGPVDAARIPTGRARR